MYIASDVVSRVSSNDSQFQTIHSTLSMKSHFDDMEDENSIEDFSSEQSDENQMNNMPVLEFSLIQPVTLASLKKDLKQIPFLCLYKAFIPLVCLIFKIAQNVHSFRSFASCSSIRVDLLNINAFILFVSSLCAILYLLMTYTRYKVFRLPYYYLRTNLLCYSTFYIILICKYRYGGPFWNILVV